MRSLSSAAGFFFCVPNTIMGDFGTQARIIDRAKRPPCAFLDAAQGKGLRRRSNRLDWRATKAGRDCGAWPRRATALCVSRYRSGKGLRRRFDRLDRRATNTGDAIAALGRDERPPCAFRDAAQGKACAGVPTGLIGAQRIRATRLRRLAEPNDRPVRYAMPLREMTCAGASTGLTGAQRKRSAIARKIPDCGLERL